MIVERFAYLLYITANEAISLLIVHITIIFKPIFHKTRSRFHVPLRLIVLTWSFQQLRK